MVVKMFSGGAAVGITIGEEVAILTGLRVRFIIWRPIRML